MLYCIILCKRINKLITECLVLSVDVKISKKKPDMLKEIGQLIWLHYYQLAIMY